MMGSISPSPKAAAPRPLKTGSTAGCLPCGFHHGFLHAVVAGPVQADLVTIGISKIDVPPAPRHHARPLRNVEPLLLELAAEAVNVADLEVQPHAIAGDRHTWPSLVQRDGAVAARRAQPRIDRCSLI